jgi:hypothetical protein
VLWRVDRPLDRDPHDGKDWPLRVEHLPPMTDVRSVRTGSGRILVNRGTPDCPYVIERLPEVGLTPKPLRRKKWRQNKLQKSDAPYKCRVCGRGFDEPATLYDHLRTNCWSYDDVHGIPLGKINWDYVDDLFNRAVYDRDDNALGQLLMVVLRLLRSKCKSSRMAKGKCGYYYQRSRPIHWGKGKRGEGTYYDRMSIAFSTFATEIDNARNDPKHPLRQCDAMLRYDPKRKLPIHPKAKEIIDRLGPAATDRDINIALKQAHRSKKERKEVLRAIHEYQAAEWGGELPPGLGRKRKRVWLPNHHSREIFWLCERVKTAIKNAERADYWHGVKGVPKDDAHVKRKLKRRDVAGFHRLSAGGEFYADENGELAVADSETVPMFDFDSRVKFSPADDFLIPEKNKRAAAGRFVLEWDWLTFWFAVQDGIVTLEGDVNMPAWVEQQIDNATDRKILLLLWQGQTHERIANRLKWERRTVTDYIFTLKNICRKRLDLPPIRKVCRAKPASFGSHIAADALRTIGEARHSGSSIPMADFAAKTEARRNMDERIRRFVQSIESCAVAAHSAV